MGDAHGRIGRVDALAARSRRAEDVDPEVVAVNIEVTAFLAFEQGVFDKGGFS